MRTNLARKSTLRTHEGAPAKTINPLQALRRSVLSCLLWEREFYEDEVGIAERIGDLATQVSPLALAALAVEARTKANLRHVPLLLLAHLAKHGSGNSLVADAICETVNRADELGELLSIYWTINGRKPNDQGKRRISAQMKKGLARAFTKFDAYQLAKYDRAGAIRLRDVLFLTHPKAGNEAQKETWDSLVNGTLASPDTWEVGLSTGGDKKETFERLLREGKLGYMAVLRNLRNFEESGVPSDLVESAILARKGADRVLPFRYLMAARVVPRYERALDLAMSKAIEASAPFKGETLVLIDTSGSMQSTVSAKSRVTRSDAAAMLGALVNGDIRVFAFATDVMELPHRPGMAGADTIQKASVGWSTNIGLAVKTATAKYRNAARIIVVTDEQSHDAVADPKAPLAYMINVASARNGIGYGRWTHIDGFSENTLRFIHESEAA